MEFTGLAAEMAELAGGYGSVDPAAADLDALEWALGAGRRLRGILDARDALITCRLEVLIHQRVPQPGPAGDASTGGAERSTGAADGGSGASGAAGGAGAGGAGAAGAGGTGGGAGGSSGGAAGAGAAGGSAGGSAGGAHRETAQEYAARLRRAKWLRRLSLFEAALEAGTITTAHVDALAAVLDHVEPTVVADVVADEAGLLEVARTGTKASFARYLRLRVDRVRADGGTARLQRQIDESFGSLSQDEDLDLYKLFVRLDPIRGEQVFTAVRRRVEQLQQSGQMDGKRRGQVIAQAVTDLICGGGEPGVGGAQVLVIADLLTLLRGPHDGSICETGDGAAIPVDVVRDLCRRAGTTMTVAVRDGNGVTVAVGEHVRPDGVTSSGPAPAPDGNHHPRLAEHQSGRAPASEADPDGRPDSQSGRRHPARSGVTAGLAAMVAEALAAATGDRLQMGRDLRLANRQQRRALRAMYRTCAHPGCRVPFADCFIHHVTPWEDDGPTDLANLLPVCGRHHHQIHDGGWRLTIDPARTLRWYQPGGRLDTEHRFEPLGATGGLAPVDAQPTAASDDATEGARAARAEHVSERSDPAIDVRWTRSRSARGAPPPAVPEPLRLFDPPAA